ncbi:hypothetical protein KIPB_008895 [Kipferlia bialata]|uniref:Uncharacterized protein n=1 Tax=Kipferlia bialata TaxID=797122 RepID=A0A9K3D3J1_9EUKA|nr:hypothetical protein KIPB_008895 [Kipferlia bialata]|eukprot:g8895.t1
MYLISSALYLTLDTPRSPTEARPLLRGCRPRFLLCVQCVARERHLGTGILWYKKVCGLCVIFNLTHVGGSAVTSECDMQPWKGERVLTSVQRWTTMGYAPPYHCVSK